MYPKILFTLLALLLASCGSIHKLFVDRKKLENSTLLVTTALVNEQLEKTEVFKLVDTTNMAYYIEITPIGEFSFSAATGFKGKAEAVKWKGTANKKQEVVSATQTGQMSQLIKNGSVNERNKDSFTSKKKVIGKVELIWWLVLGIVVFILLFRVKI